MSTLRLTLPDTDDGFITEEQFEQLPEPDLFYFELEDGNLRLVNHVTTDWHSNMIHILVTFFQRIGKPALAERQVRLRSGRIVRCDVGVLIVPPDFGAEIFTRDATEYSIVDKHPTSPSDGIVHQFVNRGGAFQAEQEIELSALVAG